MDKFLKGLLVEVQVLWFHDSSALWIGGFTVELDDGGRLIEVIGPHGTESCRSRMVERSRIRLHPSE